MANIVSAPVGGAVAGQIVIPEQQGPWAYTWPDVVAKLGSDVISGYFKSSANPDGNDEDDYLPAGREVGTTGKTPATPATIGTGAGYSSLLFLALLGLALFLLLRR